VNDIGGALQLRPEDTGWQDTVWVGPGEALKIIEKFDLPGDYVWHCHILSHENNEMMRPLHVINTINGTDKKETLTGTDDIDSITAGKGNDIVNAGAGDDRFIAEKNDGNDTYNGAPGTDRHDMSKITKDGRGQTRRWLCTRSSDRQR
jgi:Ca2+-binding RTX toxin-like protein